MVLVVRCLICAKELTYTKSDPSQLIHHVRSEHPQRSRDSEEIIVVDQQRREKTSSELRESLGRNSASLSNLIDKEAQTEVDWRFFARMADIARSSNDIASSSDSPKASKKSSSSAASIKNVSHKSPRVVPVKTSDDRKQFGEKTPLKAAPPTHKPQESAKRHKVKMPDGRDVKVLFTAEDNSPAKQHRRVYKTSIEKWRPINDEKILCPQCHSLKRPIVRTHNERVTESSLVATLAMTCWPMCFAPCLFPEPTHENLHCPVCNFHLGIYDHKRKVTLPNPELH